MSTALTHLPDTALVFEGGGMRGVYTAGLVATLIEAGLDFPVMFPAFPQVARTLLTMFT